MQKEIIENKSINEKMYKYILDNGMKVLIIPKENTNKKYVIWGTKFGSIDNHFIEPVNKREVKVPDGVAHYLEHKMFEQKSGVDSLYTLMALGLDANAYTTNDHTAYLFSGCENFYKGLDELMDYVQNPYFTDQNVEKERGIIGQEIGMYDDDPFWKLYLNTMKCLYKNNPITLDIAGTVESISKITKEILYDCYTTFYHPSNMTMCISGNFNPDQLIEEVKKRLIPHEKVGKIIRIYPEYENDINEKRKEATMKINMPMFMIGYRDFAKDEDKIKKDVAQKIIYNSILGKCSKIYNEMYEKGLLFHEIDFEYEFSDEYAHIMLSGETKNIEEVYEIITNALENIEISKEDFERSKKRLYGEYVGSFEDVEDVGRMVLADSMKGINSFDYINEINNITLEECKKIQKQIFKKEKAVLSIVK